MKDAVAAWQFEFDFHPTRREFLDNGDSAGPWRSAFRPLRNWGPPYSGRATFPLRSLIPQRVDGLLGCQHNLGFSSIVSSGFRLHDHMLAIGQAAGATGALALRQDVPPRSIPFDAALLAELQRELCARHDQGEPDMLWPFGDLEPDHPAFIPANLLAMHGALSLSPGDVDFEPDQPANQEWRKAVVEKSLTTKQAKQPPTPPSGEMTRGEFVIRWWAAIKDFPEMSFARLAPNDADQGGLSDQDDPLPFNADQSSWPDARLPADWDGLPRSIAKEFGTRRKLQLHG